MGENRHGNVKKKKKCMEGNLLTGENLPECRNECEGDQGSHALVVFGPVTNDVRKQIKSGARLFLESLIELVFATAVV